MTLSIKQIACQLFQKRHFELKKSNNHPFFTENNAQVRQNDTDIMRHDDTATV